jgi:hypothetical protein
MAHFARVEDNIVREVIVVNNDVIKDDKGIEQESIGIDFCKSLYGQDTQWLQTSYNGSFRGKYAGSGDKYDSVKNEFVSPIIEE